MRIVVQVKLLPTPEQAEALAVTLHACNTAANQVSRTVSIWTTAGRMRGVRFTGSPAQLKTLAEHRRGESDLVFRDGKWFMVATCEVPEAPLNTDPVDWIGVDRGIVGRVDAPPSPPYRRGSLGTQTKPKGAPSPAPSEPSS